MRKNTRQKFVWHCVKKNHFRNRLGTRKYTDRLQIYVHAIRALRLGTNEVIRVRIVFTALYLKNVNPFLLQRQFKKKHFSHFMFSNPIFFRAQKSSNDESKLNENEINLISDRPYLLSTSIRTPLVTKHYSSTHFYTTTTPVIPTTLLNTQAVTEIDTAPPTQTTQSSFSNTLR